MEYQENIRSKDLSGKYVFPQCHQEITMCWKIIGDRKIRYFRGHVIIRGERYYKMVQGLFSKGKLNEEDRGVCGTFMDIRGRIGGGKIISIDMPIRLCCQKSRFVLFSEMCLVDQKIFYSFNQNAFKLSQHINYRLMKNL